MKPMTLDEAKRLFDHRWVTPGGVQIADQVLRVEGSIIVIDRKMTPPLIDMVEIRLEVPTLFGCPVVVDPKMAAGDWRLESR